MNNRSAFTWIEFVVGVVILLVLVGVVLPMVIRSRRVAQATNQRFDFQAIDIALKAYHDDFGDYPRNVLLAKWNTMRDGPDAPPTPAPAFYSLAAALLGPGPAVTRTVDGDLQIGDGSDGPGIRCQSTVVAAGTVMATQGKTAATMTIDPEPASPGAAQAPLDIDLGLNGTGGTLASVTFFADSKQPYQETIGLSGASESGGKLQLMLAVGPCFPHGGRGEIRVAGGKVWGPYLAPGRFKVAFVPSVNVYGGAFISFGQAVLVDDWGQVIEYFPRYGRMNNRTEDSVFPADPSVQAGPLFGYSQPKSVDAVHGANAIWDWRDSAPFFTISGQVGPAQSWPDPVAATQRSFRPELAIEWMLGEPDAAGNFKNEIGAGQKIRYDGPYILISAGPDGPDRFNGGFCNFVDPADYSKSFPESQLQKTFQLSGNIYNFERR